LARDASGTGEAGERLQKVLAQAGLGSRRACEELVLAGRVTLNGAVARIGQRAVAAHDMIEVDGIPVPVRQGLAYYLVNKPVGVICTASDPQGRPSIVALVPSEPRVFSVGRLDVASSGLIVLTNDGDLAFQVTHPAHGVEKEYVVEVEGALARADLGRLRRGVLLEDGLTAPAAVQRLRPDAIRVVLHEGRNRQVRRMLEAVGHPVRSLARTRVGPLADPGLAPGRWRPLTAAEVMALWAAAKDGGQAGSAQRRRDGPRKPGRP